MSVPGRVLAGVESAVHTAALPYGYTLSVWGSGQMVSHAHGPPGVVAVFAFVAGAAAAYGALRLATRSAQGAPDRQLAASPHLVRAGAVQVAAIGAAVGAAALVALVPGLVAWALAGLAATGLYLLVVSAELALLEAGR